MNIDKTEHGIYIRTQRWIILAVVLCVTVFFSFGICLLQKSADQPEPIRSESRRATPFHMYSKKSGAILYLPLTIPDKFSGVVTDAWKADSSANRTACLSRWMFSHAYESLCTHLSANRILEIQIESLSQATTAFIPISLIERVSVGDRVRVLRGDLLPDGSVSKMPMLVEVFSKDKNDNDQ